jgi:hypothetical protein
MKKRMQDNEEKGDVQELTMDQATFEQAEALNRQAYEKLREQIRRDCTGQYVGIAEGRLIAVAPTFDEVYAAIEQLKPMPEYYLIFPAEEGPLFEVVDSL